MKAFFYGLLSLAPCWAAPKKEPPLTLSAQNGIVCDEKNNVCIATGSAWAKKEEVTVFGDQLKVYFAPKERSVIALEAFGHARLVHPTGHVRAERLFYDVKSQTLKATGKIIEMSHPDYHLLAHEWVIYCPNEQYGKARGHVCLTHAKGRLYADEIKACFGEKNAAALPSSHPLSLSLVQVKASGHLFFVQKDQKAKADHGLYDVKTQCAHLKGHVVMSQPGYHAKGEWGTIDFHRKKAYLNGQKRPMTLVIYPQSGLSLPPPNNKNS